MDQLRARAYLDLLLAKDSRPRPPATAGGDGGAASDSPDNGPGGSGGGPGPAGPDEPGRSPAGSAGGAVPAGFVGRVTLTAPLATLARLADRPGELGGLGPIDPWLTRDLAAAAAHNPKTTWCVTVTDAKGHAVGHGCARPEPKSHRNRAGPGPPGGTGFSFTPASRDGPPRRVRHLAAAHPGTRTRPDHHPGPPDHRPVQPPARKPGPRPWRQAPAPVPDPARHLHQPHLPAARRPVRRRAQHPVRGGRPDLPVQHRSQVPARPPAQAAPQVEGRPAPRRHLPVDNPSRPDLRHRTHPLPDLNG